jgi:hypothetical protein
MIRKTHTLDQIINMMWSQSNTLSIQSVTLTVQYPQHDISRKSATFYFGIVLS